MERDKVKPEDFAKECADPKNRADLVKEFRKFGDDLKAASEACNMLANGIETKDWEKASTYYDEMMARFERLSQ